MPASKSAPKSVAIPPSGDDRATLPIPSVGEPANLVPTTSETKPAKRLSWRLPPNSRIRATALKILALRLKGIPDAEIATALGIGSTTTLRNYMWRAGKNGWLTEEIDNPRDRLDYDIMHKVVRNMDEALDDPDDERRDKMTVEVARGTIFKSYDQQGISNAPPLNVLAIKIEMPDGEAPKPREGTMIGAPAYLDGEVADAP